MTENEKIERDSKLALEKLEKEKPDLTVRLDNDDYATFTYEDLCRMGEVGCSYEIHWGRYDDYESLSAFYTLDGEKAEQRIKNAYYRYKRDEVKAKIMHRFELDKFKS